MIKYHHKMARAKRRRRIIEALTKNKGHTNRRGTCNPQVPRSKRGGGSLAKMRTRPPKRGKRVFNGIRVEQVDVHVD